VVGGQLFIGNQNFSYQPNSSQYIIGCLNFGRAHLGTKPNMPIIHSLLQFTSHGLVFLNLFHRFSSLMELLDTFHRTILFLVVIKLIIDFNSSIINNLDNL
jgi:hypothetical protein